jgi:hypothetical protein
LIIAFVSLNGFEPGHSFGDCSDLTILTIAVVVIVTLLVPAIIYIIVYRMILAIIAGAVLILLIVAGWCAWRFMKKKRPKGADEKVGHSSFFLLLPDPREQTRRWVIDLFSYFYLTQGSRREGGSLILFSSFYLFLAIKCTDKKENKFFLIYKEIVGVEQLQKNSVSIVEYSYNTFSDICGYFTRLQKHTYSII